MARGQKDVRNRGVEAVGSYSTTLLGKHFAAQQLNPVVKWQLGRPVSESKR